MEKYEFIASTKIEAINQAKKKLVETENNLLIKTLRKRSNHSSNRKKRNSKFY